MNTIEYNRFLEFEIAIKKTFETPSRIGKENKFNFVNLKEAIILVKHKFILSPLHLKHGDPIPRPLPTIFK